MSDPINITREAILADLKERFKTGDKTVRPMDSRDEHRWHKPQTNYFSGHGETSCPVCKVGRVSYQRSPYNGHVRASCETEGCVRWQE